MTRFLWATHFKELVFYKVIEYIYIYDQAFNDNLQNVLNIHVIGFETHTPLFTSSINQVLPVYTTLVLNVFKLHSILTLGR